MWLVLTLLSLLGCASAQDTGVCECALFARIQESGLLPPNSRVVGPLYILDGSSDVTAPCNGNVESVCAQYCDLLVSDWIAEGNDLDTIVEIESPPGEFQNETIGQLMCTRSLQLSPNPPDYDGTGEEGTAVRMHMQLDPCSNWQYRGCYADLVLCCDADAIYTPCEGPVVCE